MTHTYKECKSERERNVERKRTMYVHVARKHNHNQINYKAFNNSFKKWPQAHG